MLRSIVVNPIEETQPQRSSFRTPMRAHVRRLWLEFELDPRFSSYEPTSWEKMKLSVVDSVECELMGALVDRVSGRALNALRELRGSTAPKGSLLAALRSIGRAAIEMPLLQDLKPEDSGVDIHPCWKGTYCSRLIRVNWIAQPEVCVREPRLRVEYSEPLGEIAGSPDEQFKFPVLQWQSCTPPISNETCVGNRTTFQAMLPLNHALRRLVWTVSVDGAPVRIYAARLATESDPALFELDERALLEDMGLHGWFPSDDFPIYAREFEDLGPNMSRFNAARLEIAIDAVRPSSRIVCEVHAQTANVLIACRGRQCMLFLG